MSPKDKKKKKDKSGPRRSKPQTILPKPKPFVFRSPKYYIEHARDYPIMGCWIMAGWQEAGLTPLVIARRQSEDRVIFASYLVDFYLLGVKDAMCNGDFPLSRFEKILPEIFHDEDEPCDVDLAHELIYGAIDFARKYGFEPHIDFSLCGNVLDPREAHPFHHNLEFGKDGRPLFIAGPYDDARAIMAKLERTTGEGNYDFAPTLGLGGIDTSDALAHLLNLNEEDLAALADLDEEELDEIIDLSALDEEEPDDIDDLTDLDGADDLSNPTRTDEQ